MLVKQGEHGYIHRSKWLQAPMEAKNIFMLLVIEKAMRGMAVIHQGRMLVSKRKHDCRKMMNDNKVVFRESGKAKSD